MNRCEMLISYL